MIAYMEWNLCFYWWVDGNHSKWPDSAQSAIIAAVKCPHCLAEAPDEAAECPRCGLLFAKLKAQREREKREAAEFLALAEKPAPPAKPSDPWKGRLIAAGVVLLWFVALFFYFVNDLNRRAEKTLPPGTVVPAR
jgi:hypothetical protein